MKRVFFLIIPFLIISCSHEPEIYLFTSFREPATDGLYLTYSYDGYDWVDLSGPYLAPDVGLQKLMRDPSVAKGSDDTYHMVWTTSWRGDNGFGYANTKDFVNWSPQSFIPVMEYAPDVVNVWAPEIFYDDEKDRFIIVWASTIPHLFPKGEEDELNNQRLYYTTTQDFKEFTQTKLFLEPGFSVIDAVIVKRAKEDYVLVLKDNTRPNRNLSVAFASDPLGPYSNYSEPFSDYLSEGPTVIRRGDEWIIYYDNYGEKDYRAMKTSDFKVFVDISDEVSLPQEHKHGTITTINKEVLDGLLKASAKNVK